MHRPLDGIVVADLSPVLAGPLATQTLADLGATVVKVERPTGGDDTRSWGPPWSAAGSSYFDAANRSKFSIALDLDDPDDLAVCHRLVDRADVLVENFRVGSLARHGLGPASTRPRPGLDPGSMATTGALLDHRLRQRRGRGPTGLRRRRAGPGWVHEHHRGA
jgi:crotonobetainyl-CoA:carnitine CoA-transferase CaiB-like acyl-CoA transferase